MITYIDSEKNNNAYNVLFDKASTKLGLLPIIKEVRDEQNHVVTREFYKRVYDKTAKAWKEKKCNGNEIDEDAGVLLDEEGKPIKPIGSLNEYFQHIRELAGMAIGQGRSGTDPYFLRLPLDEPFFEINANTRGITVPGELSQIAVKGDKLAEIVFFRIDRYYDAVDLNTRHIYIEWEAPDGKGGVRKGISRDFLRDTQSEKDKLIFGWAIGEELTKYVGTIKFAVRFVEWFDVKATDQDDRTRNLDTVDEESTLFYSFSSLPATVSVVDSLNYSLWENNKDLIIKSKDTNDNIGTILLYLEDSDPDATGDDTTTALPSEAPKFVRNLTDAYYTDAIWDEDKHEYKVNLKSFPTGKKLELQVEANSTDGGYISYVFGRIMHTKDEGTGIAPTAAKGLVAKIKFVEADKVFVNDKFNIEKTFYMIDKTNAYVVADEAAYNIAKSELPEGQEPQLYERVAYIEVTEPGHYYAIADNRAGGHKVNSTYSARMYIPWAAVPVITDASKMFENTELEPLENKVPKKCVISKVTYTKSKNEYAQSGDNPQSNIVYTPTDVGPDSFTFAPIAQAENGLENTNFEYQWYRHPDNHVVMNSFDITALDRPEGMTDHDWNLEEPDDIANAGWEKVTETPQSTPALTVTEPGCYALKVINNFNNDIRSTNIFDAGIARVTNTPQEPEIINWNDIKTYPFVAKRENLPSIQIEVTDHDIVRYEWHLITSDTSDEDPVAEDYMLQPNGEVSLTETAAGSGVYTGSIEFKPLKAGLFYLVLSNELNGAIAYRNCATTDGKIWVEGD